MKKLFCIYIVALSGFIGSLHALGPIEYTLLQTEAKATTLNEALAPETDCEPDCIYKYPYIQNDQADSQEKPEPTANEDVIPTDTQLPNEPEQVPSEVPEEGEERFILESEHCYKFDLKDEEEPVTQDEACYEIVIPPPTVVVVQENGHPEHIDSPPEAKNIPDNNDGVPSTEQAISPIEGLEGHLPETPPSVSQNQDLIPPPTGAPEPLQSQEQSPIAVDVVPQPQEEVPPQIQGQEIPPSPVEQQAPSYETHPQNQDLILPLEETREPSQSQEQPLIPFDNIPQSQEGQEILPIKNTLPPQGQPEVPPPEEATPPFQQQKEQLPPPANELQGPPLENSSFAPQDQQVIISGEGVPLYQNSNEAQPFTAEPQSPPYETAPFDSQNPEVIPSPEETTGPYQTQEQPQIPASPVPQTQEGPVELPPQLSQEIPSTEWNQEPPISQEQEVPLGENPLPPQSIEQGLPYPNKEEVPPPSDERVIIPPPAECEVSGGRPEVVVIVEGPENVDIHYEEAREAPNRLRATLGNRKRNQIPLQGWDESSPPEEPYGPSQDAEIIPEAFGQETQVEPIAIPKFEERQSEPEYLEPSNKTGEDRQEVQNQIPFEEGQAIENIGQETPILPPRIPTDLQLPPESREEPLGVERISAEDYEGVYAPDQTITVNPQPPLTGSGGASELESFGPPIERPEDTLVQDRRDQIPFEQIPEEVKNYVQDISNLPQSAPINQEIPPYVGEGQIENDHIPIEENQGVVHYDEEAYNLGENSSLNPETPPYLKERANLRGYSPVNQLRGGNPEIQVEDGAPLSQPEEIEPYYEGENIAPFVDSETATSPREGEIIPQEIPGYDEEAYNIPQQGIQPEIEGPQNEVPEYVYTGRISTGMTQIYGQPTTTVTYETYDRDADHEVAFTYVLTNIYSGIFKTDDYRYVVYGTGALDFYNSYYGPKPEVKDDTISCSCTCGYQGYTFNYSFDL